MKSLFATTCFVAAAALVAASAFAQTFTDETKWTGYFGTRVAQHTSSTTGTYDTVADTRANMSLIASSSVAGISGTITYATKEGRVISTQAVTLYTTPTEVSVTGPLKFQKVKLTLNAAGAATASDTRIFSRQ